MRFKSLFEHPLTGGLDIDDPKTTELRRLIVRNKRFLHLIYEEWYRFIAASLPLGRELVLELGSGAGFLSDILPGLITSEVFYCRWVDIILDGQQLPFADGTLRGIVMVDTLHHVPKPRLFFAEAARCVKLGGVILMIEPWVTSWSRLVFQKFHHEPFRPEEHEWHFPSSGPLSGANGALPWIIFQRDRARFENEFPEWEIRMVKPIMPFRYLVSGGISLRSLMPGWTFGTWRWLEDALTPWMKNLAMFAQIVLQHTA